MAESYSIVCMYVCICMHIYVHTHICIYTYAYVYTYTDICMYIYINVYTHIHTHTHPTSLSIHLSLYICFCVLVIASGVLCIIDGVRKSFWITVFSRYIPRNGLLDHMTVLFFVFWEIPIVFSIRAVPVCISIISVEDSFVSTSLSAFVICTF